MVCARRRTRGAEAREFRLGAERLHLCDARVLTLSSSSELRRELRRRRLGDADVRAQLRGRLFGLLPRDEGLDVLALGAGGRFFFFSRAITPPRTRAAHLQPVERVRQLEGALSPACQLRGLPREVGLKADEAPADVRGGRLGGVVERGGELRDALGQARHLLLERRGALLCEPPVALALRRRIFGSGSGASLRLP